MVGRAGNVTGGPLGEWAAPVEAPIEQRDVSGSTMDDRVISSPALPGGDLIAAVLDREVMGLADRGGASNLVGERWANVCAAYAERWVGQERPIPDGRQ